MNPCGQLNWQRLTHDQLADMYSKLLPTTLTSLLKGYGIHLATCNYTNPELSNEHVTEKLVTA